MYCSENSNFEVSLIEVINSGVVPNNVITEMLNHIKIFFTDTTEQDYKNVIIPKKINEITVRTNGEYAFAESDIYTIEIPKIVTIIGEDTFAYNSLLYNIINKNRESI